MKYSLMVLLLFAFACGQPLKVTTKSDPHTATSGTLGSAQFNNKLPEPAPGKPLPDTIMRKDTIR
jgi:hypothetical protein